MRVARCHEGAHTAGDDEDARAPLATAPGVATTYQEVVTMPDVTSPDELFKRINDVELEVSCLYDDLYELSDARGDGRIQQAAQHLADAGDAICAARNAFRDATGLSE
jgi:hypothetical protein